MNEVKFPYGLSNFEQIVNQNAVFVDKTHFLPELEKYDYVSYLRPRRFGKSLFLSVLEYYYDVLRKDKFEKLFGKYYIGKNPTSLANSYRILNFNFSGINTDTRESSQQGFNFSVKMSIRAFCNRYALFNEKQEDDIFNAKDAEEILTGFLDHYVNYTKNPIYILIDEYDHFTNEILYRNLNEFKDSVSKNGYVRKFYEVIKTATQQGTVARVFITGVSPITLDSLTSGFNIITHLTHEKHFETLLGFTENEVRQLLSLVLTDKTKENEVMQELKRWYNGYKFYPFSQEQLYNSDMVLYALRHFQNYEQTLPLRMLDPNIMPDYGKLKQMFEVVNVKKNQEVLQEVLETNYINAELIYQFNMERDFGKKELVNFLYYLGNLTIQEANLMGEVKFKIPNQVIAELYWQYYADYIQKHYQIPHDADIVTEYVREMGLEGKYERFFKLIQEALEHLSNRDFIYFDEKHIKMLLMAYFYQSNLFYIKSEREVKNVGYIDLELHKKPQNPFQHKEYAMEIKYLKKANKTQLVQVEEQAKQQLLTYYQNDLELQSKPDLVLLTVMIVKSKVYVQKL